MKYLYRCFLLLFFIGLLFGTEAQAQRRYKYKKKRGKSRSKSYSKFRGSKSFTSRARKFSYVGVNLNAFNYYGDITKEFGRFKSDVSFTRPGFGLHAGYQYKPNLAFRAEFNYGRITGDDEKGEGPGLENRNLNFRNDIKEFSIGLSYNFFRAVSANRRPPFNPYVHVSLAGFLHEPYGEVVDGEGKGTGQWEKLRPLGTEGQYIEGSGVEEYKPFQLAIPFGAGVMMRLPNNFNLSFEVGGRKIFTDYIDDVSGSYPDQSELSPKAQRFSNKTGGSVETGGVRGGPAKDFYIITQFKLSYIFGAGSGSSRGKFR